MVGSLFSLLSLQFNYHFSSGSIVLLFNPVSTVGEALIQWIYRWKGEVITVVQNQQQSTYLQTHYPYLRRIVKLKEKSVFEETDNEKKLDKRKIENEEEIEEEENQRRERQFKQKIKEEDERYLQKQIEIIEEIEKVVMFETGGLGVDCVIQPLSYSLSSFSSLSLRNFDEDLKREFENFKNGSTEDEDEDEEEIKERLKKEKINEDQKRERIRERIERDIHLENEMIIRLLSMHGHWVRTTPIQLDPPQSNLLTIKSCSISFLYLHSHILAPTQYGRFRHILDEAINDQFEIESIDKSLEILLKLKQNSNSKSEKIQSKKKKIEIKNIKYISVKHIFQLAN